MLRGPSADFQQRYRLGCLDEALAVLPIRQWTNTYIGNRDGRFRLRLRTCHWDHSECESNLFP